jgi:hypothetical protein
VILEGLLDFSQEMRQDDPNEERIIPIRTGRKSEFFFLCNILFLKKISVQMSFPRRFVVFAGRIWAFPGTTPGEKTRTISSYQDGDLYENGCLYMKYRVLHIWYG